MRKLLIILSAASILGFSFINKEDSKLTADRDLIKKVVENAYVKGVHTNRDIPAVREGFHPGFEMCILRDNSLDKLPIYNWIERIEKDIRENPNPKKVKVEHEFRVVDITGHAAIVKVDLYKDSKHIYTDYLSLYKFEEGWKIVAKVFYRHN